MGNGCSVHGVARRKLGKRDIQWLVAHTQFSSEAEIATLYRGEETFRVEHFRPNKI